MTNSLLVPDSGGTWSVQEVRSPVAPQRAAMRAQVSFVISELPLRPDPTRPEAIILKHFINKTKNFSLSLKVKIILKFILKLKTYSKVCNIKIDWNLFTRYY